MARSIGLLLAIVVAASEAFSPALRISTSRLLNGASVSRAGPAYRLLGWPLAPHQPQGRGTWAVQMVEKAGAGSRGGARRGGGGGRAGGKRGGKGDSRPLKGVWRVFNVEVPASEDEGKDGVGVTRQLVSAVGGRLGVEVRPCVASVGICEYPDLLTIVCWRKGSTCDIVLLISTPHHSWLYMRASVHVLVEVWSLGHCVFCASCV